jgi:ketosteroid isomerase-like protein
VTKKAPSKGSAARKRGGKAAAAKSTRKRTAATKRSRGVSGARKPARRQAVAKRPDPGAALAALARRIVEVTTDTSDPLAFLTLYSPDVVSTEATMQVVRGLEGLQEKARGWEEMQEGVTWTARSVCVDPLSGTICIEWDAQVKLRGGPTVPMREVAIHEVRDGKIVAERYYYNPGALTPAGADIVAAG